MTDLSYTDDDLRAQAALCQSALSFSPTVADIIRWLPGAYITGRSGDTWGNVLDNAGLAETARKIHGLIEQAGNTIGALDAARWLIDLSVDGLQPTSDCLTFKGDERPIVRVHFAFPADMPEDARRAFVAGAGEAIAADLF